MSAYFKFEGDLRLALRAEMQGEEVRHISQSRRLRPGDDFLLQDRLGQRFRVKLLNQIRQRLEFEVLEAVVVPESSPLSLELWLALPKEKALELILQKGVELGVSRVVLFQGEFSSGRAETPTINTQQRWERIMSEACKQSGRQFSPTWTWFQSLEAALCQTTATDQHWIFAPLLDSSDWPISEEEMVGQKHTLWIGPEGGWHASELELAHQAKVRSLTLGPRILRTETAAISAMTIFQHRFGDLN
ncbi:MAG: 16S rRNA methyltransferase [Deltaproteobacteria bacterium]|nr:16S rRNA methyltransferase [Deltaproteobacteria bacterium]